MAGGPLGKSCHLSGPQFPQRIQVGAVDWGSSDCFVPRSRLGRVGSVFSTLICHIRFCLKKGFCGQKKKSLKCTGLLCPRGHSGSAGAGTGYSSFGDEGRDLWSPKLRARRTNKKGKPDNFGACDLAPFLRT